MHGGDQHEDFTLGSDKDVLAFLTTKGLSQYAPTFAMEKISAHNTKDNLEEHGLTSQEH